MRQLPYQIGPSPIHGRGVFATNFIPAGTEVLMPESGLDDHLFLQEEGKFFHGFNHSCNNNLGSWLYLPQKHPQARMALRDIQEGEELTVNYFHTGGRVGRCNCEMCR
jgi:SET domain-containing protein